VLEELDAPGEFVVTAAGDLYLIPNRTGVAWQDAVFAAVTERVVQLSGNGAADPVHDIRFQGVACRFVMLQVTCHFVMLQVTCHFVMLQVTCHFVMSAFHRHSC
jgi:hypothetical protein